MKILTNCPYCEKQNNHDIKILSMDFPELVTCNHCANEYIVRVKAHARGESIPIDYIQSRPIDWKNEMALDGVTEALKRGW